MGACLSYLEDPEAVRRDEMHRHPENGRAADLPTVQKEQERARAAAGYQAAARTDEQRVAGGPASSLALPGLAPPPWAAQRAVARPADVELRMLPFPHPPPAPPSEITPAVEPAPPAPPNAPPPPPAAAAAPPAVVVPRNASPTKPAPWVGDGALFFPDDKLPCRAMLKGRPCQKPGCKYAHVDTSLSKLLAVLRLSRATLDVAIYNLGCEEITDELLEAKKRGVRLRLVTDCCERVAVGSDVHKLLVAGVPVKVNKSNGGLMHHKFAVVDAATLLSGSFNWTRHAVTANYENIMVVRDPALVAAFSREYEQLWSYCDPLDKSAIVAAPGPAHRAMAPLGGTAPHGLLPRTLPTRATPHAGSPTASAVTARAPGSDPKPDPRSGQRAVYRVVTATADAAEAATDATVVVRLLGSERDGAGATVRVERTLSVPGEGLLFQRNQSDVFQFECGYLGDIVHAGLELRRGAGPAWSGRTEWVLDTLTVLDLFGGQEWRFACPAPFGRRGQPTDKSWDKQAGARGLTLVSSPGGVPSPGSAESMPAASPRPQVTTDADAAPPPPRSTGEVRGGGDLPPSRRVRDIASAINGLTTTAPAGLPPAPRPTGTRPGYGAPAPAGAPPAPPAPPRGTLLAANYS